MITADLDQITQHITAALEMLDDTPVITDDPVDAQAALNAGTAVVIVNPPTYQVDTYTVCETTVDVWIIAPTSDVHTAQRCIDEILTALVSDPNTTPDTARPDTFQRTNGASLPGYVLTITL